MTTRIRQLPMVLGVAVLLGGSAIGQGQSKPPTPVVIGGQGGQASPDPSATTKSKVPGLRGIDPEDYRIGPEDVLDITVWKSEELTRSVPVRPDGKITVPLLNDIQAANMTPMQLRDTLAKGYAEYLQPAAEHPVSVSVKEIHSIKVSVVGHVKTSGQFELKDQATVLEALALAGGLDEYAKKDRLVVFRRVGPNSYTKLPFNYAKVVTEWDEQQNFALQPGDIIIVP